VENLSEVALVHEAAPSLSQPFVDANFDFYQKQLAGLSEIKPRWKQCATAADQYLGEAVGQEYVARYFPPEAKARAQQMVKNILAAMSETVEQLDWMSPETKKKAQEKISTFNVKVGYPDRWKDEAASRFRGVRTSMISRQPRNFRSPTHGQ
jgi:endothelin-converting enzyme/putative endopeptidase